MTVVFVLPYIPNPRMNKRIELLKKTQDVKVLCVRRSSQNIWEPCHTDIEYIIYDIDLPIAKHIFKRVLMSGKFRHSAVKKLKSIEPGLLYVEGFDALCIAYHYKKVDASVKIIYETADIREEFIESSTSIIKRIITTILKKEEAKRISVVDKLIITSMKFYESYYKNLIEKQRVLFIPNAPDVSCFSTYKKKSGGKFTVGFIGGIRYLKQMKMLVDVSERVDCQVLFAGAGGTNDDFMKIKKYCEGKEKVIFTGRYDYKKEIASLYGKVDCIYAVYDASNLNVKIALPNKLYESVYCEIPIIVAKGTYLAEIVNQWGVGVSVSHNDPSDLEEKLKQLIYNTKKYEKITENCKRHKSDIDMNAANAELYAAVEELID